MSNIKNQWLFLVVFIFFLTSACGGSSSSGGGSSSSDNTRNITGTVDSTALTSSLIWKKNLKFVTLGCSDVQVCCFGYDGTASVADVADDCSFTLALPLESVCYCSIFSGGDGDSDGCGDSFVATLGCSETGYSGGIPIFADDDDSTDDIDFGSVSVQGDVGYSSTDPCSQVDTDDDGTDDAADTDSDGDGVEDDGDFVCGDGCLNADDFDSNDNDVPDIYESTWDGLSDSDSDNIPDFCDVSEECDCSEEDTDCDCLPDDDDESLEDDDGDGVTAEIDCDDDDAEATYDCYLEALCALDFDGDGTSLCDDCDDFDSDDDRTIDEGCEDEISCTISACDHDFGCQLVADERVNTNPICSGGSVSCMTCVDGCCVVTN